MARNAYALALLMALGLAGCSKLPTKLTSKLPFLGEKPAKAAEVNLAALKARTDSLRKARRVADSLAVIRHSACVDSVRAVLTKAVIKKTKGKARKRQSGLPSPELIATQAQTACERITAAPQAKLAKADSAPAKPAARDSLKPPARAKAEPVPAASVAAPAQAPQTATQPDTLTPTHDIAWADSVRRAKEMEMSRETFAYSGASRDPFNSVLNMAKSGPELADLQLVGIYQNLRTANGSVAVFREKDGGKRHKLRAGDQVGRSRLVQIRERDVVFTIEDFGFERQETLSLRKQEDVAP